ncbi:MAG: hypothetical protein NZ108_08705 [Bacteroidia bacterium]|nr:hypothetical protein [Bacteroidia bacterium]
MRFFWVLLICFFSACSWEDNTEQVNENPNLGLEGTELMKFPVKLYANDRDTTLQPCTNVLITQPDFAFLVLGKKVSKGTKFYYCSTIRKDTVLLALLEEWNPNLKVPVRYLATFNQSNYFIDILTLCDIPSIFTSHDDPLKTEIFANISEDLTIEIRQVETPRKGYEKLYQSSETIQRFKILPNGNFDSIEQSETKNPQQI